MFVLYGLAIPTPITITAKIKKCTNHDLGILFLFSTEDFR